MLRMRSMVRVARAAFLVCAAGVCGVGSAQETALAIFSFDDGTARDLSGNGVTTSLLGAPVFGAGYEGGGLITNGTSGVRVNLDINPATQRLLTMGGWVKASAIDPVRHFLSHDNGGYDRNLGIDNRGGGNGWSAFKGTGVVGYVPAVANQWQFVAVVYDDIAGTAMLYVDGQSRSASGRTGVGNTFLYIGRSTCCNVGVPGSIDGVFFLGEALSVERLDEIWAGGIHKVPKCPLFFDQPADRFACLGGESVFRVDAAGSGTLTYRWRLDGVELFDISGRIEGSGTDTLRVRHIVAGFAGLYDCIVTNACGSKATDGAMLMMCPPDFDCDGFVTGADFDTFVQAFEEGDPLADFDRDGFITGVDFDLYVQSFEQGC